MKLYRFGYATGGLDRSIVGPGVNEVFAAEAKKGLKELGILAWLEAAFNAGKAGNQVKRAHVPHLPLQPHHAFIRFVLDHVWKAGGMDRNMPSDKEGLSLFDKCELSLYTESVEFVTKCEHQLEAFAESQGVELPDHFKLASYTEDAHSQHDTMPAPITEPLSDRPERLQAFLNELEDQSFRARPGWLNRGAVRLLLRKHLPEIEGQPQPGAPSQGEGTHAAEAGSNG